MVARLAVLKAEAIDMVMGPGERIVIAADTTVVEPKGKKVLGKPRGRADAIRMLRTISGKTHTVLTGYCLLGTQGSARGRGSQSSVVRVVKTSVKIRSLSTRDISAYLATGESMDKAGAYAAQGHGATLIEELRGSYTNVVGLPVAQLVSDLEGTFGLSLFGWRRR